MGLGLGFGLNNIGGVSIPTPTLSYDFSQGVPGAFTFTRGSTGLYTDVNGTEQSASNNTPRFAYSGGVFRGLQMEVAATNYLKNSSSPGTQTTGSLATGTYILWVEGSGSATITTVTGAATGLGTATSSSPIIFSVTTAGTFMVTVTGSVSRFQLEGGIYKSSFISTPVAATGSRSQDFLSYSGWGGFNSSEGTLLLEAELIKPNTNVFSRMVSMTDGSTINDEIGITVNGTLGPGNVAGIVKYSGTTLVDFSTGSNSKCTDKTITKAGLSYKAGTNYTTQVVNGKLANVSSASSIPTSITRIEFGTRNSVSGSNVSGTLFLRKFKYWNKRLTATQLLNVLTQ